MRSKGEEDCVCVWGGVYLCVFRTVFTAATWLGEDVGWRTPRLIVDSFAVSAEMMTKVNVGNVLVGPWGFSPHSLGSCRGPIFSLPQKNINHFLPSTTAIFTSNQFARYLLMQTWEHIHPHFLISAESIQTWWFIDFTAGLIFNPRAPTSMYFILRTFWAWAHVHEESQIH